MISPNVRVSFAIRLRRISAGVGKLGVVGVSTGVPVGVGVPGVSRPGVEGVGVDGVDGVAEEGDCVSTVLGSGSRRSIRGRRFSIAERDLNDLNFIEHFFFSGGISALALPVGKASEMTELVNESEV